MTYFSFKIISFQLLSNKLLLFRIENMCFHYLHVGHRCGPSIMIGRTRDSELKCESSEKFGALEERDGENGGNSA